MINNDLLNNHRLYFTVCQQKLHATLCKSKIILEYLIMPEEWLKTTEAAEISGYHPNHIRRLIRAGEIEARKWGAALMIHRQSLLDYLERAESQGGKRGPKHQG
jgi:excisionase family DNA binding protein